MTTDSTNQKRAFLYASAAILLWSTAASAFKISLRYINVLPLIFFASIVSTVTFFMLISFSGKISSLKTLSKKDFLMSALLGFLNPFLYYVVLTQAYDILRAQEAMTINWLWPITLVLLSIPLLHQRIKIRSILAIIISFLGVFIIAAQGKFIDFKFSNPAGFLLAIGSTVIWSLFWIYNVKDKRDVAIGLFLNFAFGSVYIFTASLLRRSGCEGWMLLFTETKFPSVKGILGAIYIGLFEMGVTFLVWLKALKLAKTTAHVANLVLLVPFFSLVVIHFVAGEEIFPSTIIGLVLIVGGIILQKIWD